MKNKKTWNLIGGEELFRYLDDLYFFKKDRNLCFVSCNENFLKLCGVDDLSGLLGKNDMDFFPKSIAERYIKDDEWVMKTGKPLINTVEVNLTPDGVRWFQTSKAPLFVGDKIIGVVGVAKDLRRTISSMGGYDVLRPAIDAMETDPGADWRMDELARKVHLSLSQFERSFKKALNMTAKKYLLTVRLEGVEQALKIGEESLASLALRFGFHDQSHLSRQFKARYGTSPMRYKKRLQQQDGDESTP
jgi:AraC-like DNA-binding protein